MKTSSILPVFALVLTLSSCTLTVPKTKSRTNRTAEVASSTLVREPQIASYDIDLNQKANGIAEGKLTYPNTIESFKQDALASAITSSNADFLVDPVYDIENDNGFIRVKVTGYPARYTKFSKINMADTVQMKYYYFFQSNPNVIIKSTPSNTSIFGSTKIY